MKSSKLILLAAAVMAASFAMPSLAVADSARKDAEKPTCASILRDTGKTGTNRKLRLIADQNQFGMIVKTDNIPGYVKTHVGTSRTVFGNPYPFNRGQLVCIFAVDETK